MSNKHFKNFFLVTFLYWGGIFFEFKISFILKIFIILIYKYPLKVLILIIFKIKESSVINIVIRNSVMEISNFNPFFSDLDFSIIIQKDFNNDELRRGFNTYVATIKKVFFFIDYPEIYTKQEYETIKIIEKDEDVKFFFKYILNLRKITWEYDKKNISFSNYHRYKAERSIKKSVSVVEGIRSTSGVAEVGLKECNILKNKVVFKSDKRHDLLPIKSQFLDMPFNNFHKGLKINAANDHIFLFLSLLPEGDNCFFYLYKEIRGTNKIYEDIYQKFCFKEYLICKSVLRTWENPSFKNLEKDVHINQLNYLKKIVVNTDLFDMYDCIN